MNDISKLTELEKIKYILKGYLKGYISECTYYDFTANEEEQVVEINIRKNEGEDSFKLLRLGLSYRNKEMYIFNIYLPQEDRKKEIGLGIINVLYHVSKNMNVALVLHSMTEGFYNAMLKRGAHKTGQHDCLVITDETDLGELNIS